MTISTIQPSKVHLITSRAKPSRLTELARELNRLNEQLDVIYRDAREQREIADRQVKRIARPVTEPMRLAAADRVAELDRQKAALVKTSQEIRDQIALINPVVVAALEPVRDQLFDQIKAARDVLYETIAAFNAVAHEINIAGASCLSVPARMPHLDGAIKTFEEGR